MKQTLTIPETFLGIGYTRDRAGLPLASFFGCKMHDSKGNADAEVLNDLLHGRPAPI